MKLEDIANQLRAVLPKFTNKFGTPVSVSSLTSSGSTVTATATAHGHSVNDYVLIKGAKVPYAITSMTSVGTQATVLTTESNQIVFQEDSTVEIIGADQSDYNGTKTLIEPKIIKITSLTKIGNTITAETDEEHGFIVSANFRINIWGIKEAIYNQIDISIASTPTSTSFTYTVQGETTSPATAMPIIKCQAIYNPYTFFFEVSGSPVTPATGTMYQLLTLNGGYNGFYIIATVPTVDTFTYTMNLSSLNSPAQGTITSNSSRIDAAISAQRALETYTQQTAGKYWLYVIPNSEITSKNRKELTDANYVYKKGNEYFQRVIYSFDLLLFIPTTGSLANGDSWDLAQDIKPYIIKSIVGSFLNSDFDENNTNTSDGITYLGSAPVDFEKNSFYSHSFSFEVTETIQSPDVTDQDDFFAFRRVTETYIDENEDATGLITDVKFN